jgi:RND family efflux transporter MFP subunit
LFLKKRMTRPDDTTTIRAVAENDHLEDELASLRIDRGRASGGSSPSSAAPKKGGGAGVWLIALIVVGALGAGGWLLFREGQNRIFPDEVELGTITLVSPAQEEVTLVATGYVYPKKKATVAPKTVGRLARLLVDEGDLVKENQVVAELETADPIAQRDQIRADIAAAQARVERARADVADAEVKLSRDDDLQKRGAGTTAARDDSKLRLDSAKAQLRAAEAEVRSVEARYAANAVQLENTKVRAPFSGTVVRKLSEVGEILAPAIAGSQQGVIQLASLDDQEVWADVSEAQFAKVRVGTPAEIILDAFAEKRFRGEVTDIRPGVDRSKASVTVKVKFLDDIKGVLPDMAAKVSFLQHALGSEQLKAAPKLVAPADSIVDKAGRKLVYAVDEDHVKEVTVQVGAPLGSMVELKNGPTTGTRVVRHPSPELRDGASVKEKKK